MSKHKSEDYLKNDTNYNIILNYYIDIDKEINN